MKRLRELLPLVAVIVGLAGLGVLWFEQRGQSTQLASASRNQVVNRAENVESWCSTINRGRDYTRSLTNLSKKQQKAEVKLFFRALRKLSPKERAFWTEFFRGVVDLEKSAPELAHLHDYRLPDLPCEALIRETLHSPHGSSSTVGYPIVRKLLREHR